MKFRISQLALIAALAFPFGGPVQARPIDDGGIRASKIDAGDEVKSREATAFVVPSDGTSAINVSEKINYYHSGSWWKWGAHDTKYSIQTTTTAQWVPELGQWMLRDNENGYIAFHAGSKVGAVVARPSLNMGELFAPLGNDGAGEVSSVQAGNIFAGGLERQMVFTVNYVHPETYFDRLYTMKTTVNASWVAQQNAHMTWFHDRLYQVRIGSSNVKYLPSKAYTDLGVRSSKLDWNDQQRWLNVEPYRLSNDGYSVLVRVKRTFRHEDQFQLLDYDLVTLDTAFYNSTYQLWTVMVDGRIYALNFGDDVISNPDVTVVQVPGSIHRPKVVVVPAPQGDGPVVVVPAKPAPRGPVVHGDEDGPVVVVPAKPTHRAPAPVVRGDDDGPAVVVPAKPR